MNNSPDIILLDDGFQHRKVKAGLYILLTSFNKLFTEDYLLPSGDLREPKSGAKRADVIIVTKCPKDLKEETKAEIAKKIKLNSNQKLFFSGIAYDDTIYSEKESTSINILNGSKFSLVTGIANSNPLVEYLESIGLSFEHLNYKDHYNFTEKDLDKLNRKKLILTTEKDFMRLKGKLDASKLFYLPIKTEI